MAEKLKRAQIMIEPEQYRQLTLLAKQAGKSISALIREAVGQYLTSQSAETLKQQRLSILESLAEIREGIQGEYGVIERDMVQEARLERKNQQEEITELWEQWS